MANENENNVEIVEEVMVAKPLKISKGEATGKILELFRANGIKDEGVDFRVHSVIHDIENDSVDETVTVENEKIREELKSSELRLQNAMTMFESAKGVIHQRDIVIEFLMSRLGATNDRG